MSFSLTTDQFRARTKTVTRRLGWASLKAGEVLMACVKCQGIPKGGKVERLGPIRVVAVRREPLRRIGPSDVVEEGFPDMMPGEFVMMFCRHNGCTLDTVVTRIEFAYLDATMLEFAAPVPPPTLLDRAGPIEGQLSFELGGDDV